MYLIFDTETTGLPYNFEAPYTDLDNWPRLVQIAWQLHDQKGKLLEAQNFIIKPDGFTIPFNSEKVHGISTEIALEEGMELEKVLAVFSKAVERSEWIIGHNIEFDINIMGAEYLRAHQEYLIATKEVICTKLISTDYVALPGGKGGEYKWPTLTELHQKLFGEDFNDAHDAAYDVAATAKCFFGLIQQGVIVPKDDEDSSNIQYEEPQLDVANFTKRKRKAASIPAKFQGKVETFLPFTHLHVHTQFSILQSTIDVKSLINKAKNNNMQAIALTDMGNMHAAFNAVAEGKRQGIKVIIGCELFVAEKRKQHQFTKNEPDKRFRQVLLAKNQTGYHQLSKLSSLGYIEGYYAGIPRVDKDLIVEYKENLIALTGGVGGEIPGLILNKGEHEAEEAFKWWLDVFGDDFYVEINRHGTEEEERVNEVLLRLAAKYDVKPIACNDVYYIEKDDSDAHDSLLCVKEAEFKSTPIGRGRGFRYGFPNNEFYLKTQEEMNNLFSDMRIALENTQEVVDKCTELTLKRDILMPKYEIPEDFKTQDDYLRHLSYEGAKRIYGSISEEISQRLDHELAIIQNMGFPGYFLIVQDFINEAKNRGVAVGPGRGSAAGSLVAYCTGITNIDPLRYQLLFERFLNPERISMPDIDVDFDDEGRQAVIDYVIEKYGKNQVAQIVTYGTMAARMSIRDVARVLELPLDKTNALAKYVPERPGTKLHDAYQEVTELKELLNQDERIHLETKVLKQAKILEGSVRNTGIHAAGVIIAPDDIRNYIPVCTSKDADLLVTQYDGKVVEDAGMLKMDFLGLKTLTIIKTALKLIQKNHKVSIDMDLIPLDDPKTFELYQNGDTVGTFQFESEGMRMYLKELKPTNIEDLIAMNALYRPGPMDFIPNFIDRKHGREKVEYPHPLLEAILQNTYGIMVYQEQIMQTAQIMAGYSLGQADLLRRAMGKKKASEMEKQRAVFVKGAEEKHQLEKEKAEEIFSIMEKFAAYGFNRSHSAAYSVVAYQTAYLKAHYPAEYMSAVLTHNMNNIDKITFFLSECRKQGISVLGPDINESNADFDVNTKGSIRFGLAAIKGSGESAVQSIIEERNTNGWFQDIFDFVKRINLRTVNKKTLECLAYAGAFDSFLIKRAQYFWEQEGDNTHFIEKIIRYGNAVQEQKNNRQQSLFGGADNTALIPHPKAPTCEDWNDFEKLKFEKEVVGFYISGHPLDQYRLDISNFCTCTLDKVLDFKEKEVAVAGIVSSFSTRQSKNGNYFTLFNIEDYSGALQMALFGGEHTEFSKFIEQDKPIYIKGVVQRRFGSDDKWELKPSLIESLSHIRSKLTKGVEVFINLDRFNHNSLEKLMEVIQKNKGGKLLNINIQGKVMQEESQGISDVQIKMVSRKYQVSISNECMDELMNIPGMSSKIMT